MAFAAPSPQSEPVHITSATVVGTNLVVRWQGAVPPYKLQVWTDPAAQDWRDFSYHIYTNEFRLTKSVAPQAMFRVRTIPDRLPPTLTGGLTGVADSCQSVSLLWSPAADNVGGTLLRGYRIYRNGDYLAEVAGPTLTFQDRSVEASSIYGYELTAIDHALNESPRTALATVVTPSCGIPNLPPVARGGSARAAATGQVLQFSGLDSTDPDGSIIDFAWTFGDGTTGSGATPTHVYNLPGAYQVRLTVTDDGGAVASAVVTVTVTGSPGSGKTEVAAVMPGIGVARDVQISGQLAYVAGDDHGLTAVDVANPNRPFLVGAANHPMTGGRLSLSGSRAVVTGWRQFYSVSDGAARIDQVNGLYLFDLVDPARLRLLGSLEDVGTIFNGCHWVGNYVYVAAGSAGLLVIDVSNPASPSQVAVAVTPGVANSVTVANGVAYVADGTSGVTILDVTNPRSPFVVTTVDTDGNAKDLALSGSRVYVADSQFLLVFDLLNPRALSLRGSLSLPGAVRVSADAHTAYVAAGANGLVCIDASTPASPVVSSAQPALGGPGATTLGVALSTSVVYVANGGGGLGAVAKPGQAGAGLSLLSTVAEWNDGTHLALKPGLAAVAFTRATEGGPVSWFGVRLFDVSVPERPNALGSFETNTFSFWQTAFHGDYLVGVCGQAGLRILDIRNPTAPRLAASLAIPGSARGIVVAGNRAFIAAGTEGLHIVDLSNPTAPILLGSATLQGNALSVAVDGTYAYIGGNTTFNVVDVSAPARPVLRGTFAAAGSDVQVHQGLAYLAGTVAGLIILDISNPTLPRWRGQVPPPSGSGQTTVGIFLSGTKAYLANSAGGLGIVTVANSSAPVYEEALLGVGLARSVAVLNGWAFLSDSKSTLVSVRLGF